MRRQPARPAGLLTLALGALLLAACQDPSGVGLTVLDPGEIDPNSRVILPETVEQDRLARNMGFSRSAVGTIEGRFLAGSADDPLVGAVAATGYFDVMQPAQLPTGFSLAPIDRVIMELRPNYVYGDTTASVTYDLFQIANSWAPSFVPTDSTLAALSPTPIRSFTVAPADSILRIEMPEDWVVANDTTFRSTAFNTRFHGLRLTPRDGSQAVRGFDPNARLLVLSDPNFDGRADTTIFVSSQILTTVTRDLETGAFPEAVLPLQNGPSRGMLLTFDLDELQGRGLATVFLSLRADTTLLRQQLPPNFARPRAERLALYGLGTSAPVLLAEAVYDARTETFVFGSVPLTNALQDAALGRSRFERFGVGFPRTPVTLNLAPIVLTGEDSPRLIVLEVPTAD